MSVLECLVDIELRSARTQKEGAEFVEVLVASNRVVDLFKETERAVRAEIEILQDRVERGVLGVWRRQGGWSRLGQRRRRIKKMLIERLTRDRRLSDRFTHL